MKITIIASGGMGGTEKAAFLFAAELSRRGFHVDALTEPSGCRVAALMRAGVQIWNVPHHDQAEIEKYLNESKPDVIYNHTSGYADNRALYHALDTFGANRPRLIETNVFGRLMDAYEGDRVDMRMFISQANGCQAFRRPRLDRRAPSPDRHLVLYYPLPLESKSNGNRAKVNRVMLDIPEDACVLVRVGRPSHKWTDWECEAFHRAATVNHNLRMILMEPPSDLKRRIRDGRYGNGIHILDATADEEFITDLYRISDVMIHASLFGESFGYTLAEGMHEHLPVIARTTPWGDNAQVELVEHGQTGFVCGTVAGMADAIGVLAKNTDLRDAMGESACSRIENISNLSRETDLLVEVIYYVLSGKRGSLMKERYDSWMDFSQHEFEQREWCVHEKTDRHWRHYLAARGYSLCRQSRVMLSPVYRSLLAKFGHS